ncbi:uncharacterized protein LOC135822992 [Sycon ciliatum]|uniref:uncharacterized protein LOC135822992 n=1 Tax=Sycon ciliatum TaxID=27933 RepID=UPI0031F67255
MLDDSSDDYSSDELSMASLSLSSFSPVASPMPRAVDAAAPSSIATMTTMVAEAARQAAIAAVQTVQPTTMAQSPMQPGSTTYTQVNLPKLSLPSFSGDILDWPVFWDMYVASVDSQQLPNVTKFTYLKSSLKGSACRLIAGIAVTDQNYPVALKTLQDEFGRADVIITKLYHKLQHMPASTSSHSDIKAKCEMIENVCLQLEAQGEVLATQRLVAQQILSKFPISVTTKLEEWRPLSEAAQAWSVSELRRALKRYVSLHDRAYQRSATSSTSRSDSSVPAAPAPGPVSGSALPVATAQQHRVPTASGQQSRRPCVFCGATHRHDSCQKFATPEARKNRLLELRLCFRCLGSGHTSSVCTRQRQCRHCLRSNHHNTAICSAGRQTARYGDSQQSRTGNPQQQQSATTSSGSSSSLRVSSNVAATQQLPGPTVPGSQTRLMTARTSIHSGSGESQQVTVLLDSGSQSTFLSVDAATRLGLPAGRQECLVVSTFASSRPVQLNTTTVEFDLELHDGSRLTMEANTMQKITDPIRHCRLSDEDYATILAVAGDALAEPISSESSTCKIDLLIGAAHFWELINGPSVSLPSGLHVIPSRLGYLVAGKSTVETDHSESASSVLLCSTLTSARQHPSSLGNYVAPSSMMPYPDLSRMWSLDTIGITDSPHVTSDELAQRHFDTHVRYEGQRYEIAWPWKAEPPEVSDNFGLALGRLTSLAKRLASDNDLLAQYNKIIQSQVTAGIIELVPKSSLRTANATHYLPHQPVITPSKATTKLRIVYDASAKSSKRSKSLNECMHRGPINLPSLCGMLLRFRCHPIVLLADIEKAFLQLSITQSDRDVTRFLWFQDPSNPAPTKDNLSVYRFRRMPFGVISSPFLLEATVRHHLSTQGTPLATAISDNIYVDNIILGMDLESAAIAAYTAAKDIFKSASMNLREFTTNSDAVRSAIPEQDRVTSRYVKVLGLKWDTENDTVSIPGCTKLTKTECSITKRAVLHAVSAVYDPLGLVTPVLLPARIFLQRLWGLSVTWDDALPPDVQEEWLGLVQQMDGLSDMAIPRYHRYHDGDMQLHIFTDASQHAYAAAAYLRIQRNSNVHTVLVYSKMRLSPSSFNKGKCAKDKSLTIPRLELLGVLIGARMAAFIRQHLQLSLSSQVLWCDSKCVLHWLQSTKDLSTFVDNRIQEIRQIPNLDYRYVPSSFNPADVATRGQSTADLSSNTLWWQGPAWLRLDVAEWPGDQHLLVTPDILQQVAAEERGSKVVHAATLLNTNSLDVTTSDLVAWSTCLVQLLDRSSSLERLIRVIFYCCRFLHQYLWSRLSSGYRSTIHTSHPLLFALMQAIASSAHLNAGIRRLILTLVTRVSQYQCFGDVFNSFVTNRKCVIRSQLGITVDQFGVLRCHGRTPKADYTVSPFAQPLLPNTHRLTQLIITDLHCRLLHAGVSHTLAQLRLNFWVPQGRRAVSSIIRRCTTCRKHEGPPYKLPVPPPLPKERVTPAARPFEYVGLDYFGPILVKQSEGKTAVKVWVCLLTCLSVRAVHLEWVSNMSTIQFISCFRRFIARRGVPRLLYSDNASQFKSASTALDEFWQSAAEDTDVFNFLNSHGICWKFATAFAPWQGGVYERMVGLVKRCLRKALGRQRIYLDQLVTLLAEAEAAVNSRPLTSVTADYEGKVNVLTPAHFLVGECPTAIPLSTSLDEPDFVPDSANPSTRLLQEWGRQQRQSEVFWQMWKKEYLQVLQERISCADKRASASHQQTASHPQLGEVVLVEEESTPRCLWKLGRIAEIICSPTDGQIRTAQVIMSTGNTVKRPLSRLYSLECRHVIPVDASTPGQQPVSSDVTDPAPVDDAPPLPVVTSKRPPRASADAAREKIAKWVTSSYVCLTS